MSEKKLYQIDQTPYKGEYQEAVSSIRNDETTMQKEHARLAETVNRVLEKLNDGEQEVTAMYGEVNKAIDDAMVKALDVGNFDCTSANSYVSKQAVETINAAWEKSDKFKNVENRDAFLQELAENLAADELDDKTTQLVAEHALAKKVAQSSRGFLAISINKMYKENIAGLIDNYATAGIDVPDGSTREQMVWLMTNLPSKSRAIYDRVKHEVDNITGQYESNRYLKQASDAYLNNLWNESGLEKRKLETRAKETTAERLSAMQNVAVETLAQIRPDSATNPPNAEVQNVAVRIQDQLIQDYVSTKLSYDGIKDTVVKGYYRTEHNQATEIDTASEKLAEFLITVQDSIRDGKVNYQNLVTQPSFKETSPLIQDLKLEYLAVLAFAQGGFVQQGNVQLEALQTAVDNINVATSKRPLPDIKTTVRTAHVASYVRDVIKRGFEDVIDDRYHPTVSDEIEFEAHKRVLQHVFPGINLETLPLNNYTRVKFDTLLSEQLDNNTPYNTLSKTEVFDHQMKATRAAREQVRPGVTEDFEKRAATSKSEYESVQRDLTNAEQLHLSLALLNELFTKPAHKGFEKFIKLSAQGYGKKQELTKEALGTTINTAKQNLIQLQATVTNTRRTLLGFGKFINREKIEELQAQIVTAEAQIKELETQRAENASYDALKTERISVTDPSNNYKSFKYDEALSVLTTETRVPTNLGNFRTATTLITPEYANPITLIDANTGNLNPALTRNSPWEKFKINGQDQNAVDEYLTKMKQHEKATRTIWERWRTWQTEAAKKVEALNNFFEVTKRQEAVTV